MSRAVSFRLNGQPVTVRRDDGAPLLFALRGDLELKDTRFGCGREQCGACMVCIDGRAVYACTMPLDAVSGADVVTADGLAGHPVGAALLDAFQTEQAGQCGYCLSGILMSAFALLSVQPNPDHEAILAALDPHLCRCGAYSGILLAVERAAAHLAGASA